jgi:hypothetical protein
LPIFFGSRSFQPHENSSGFPGEEEKIGNFFQENHLQELPDIQPKACLEICRHLLEKIGITMSSEMNSATVREIVREVTKYLFVCGWESRNIHQLTSSATERIVTVLNECLENLAGPSSPQQQSDAAIRPAQSVADAPAPSASFAAESSKKNQSPAPVPAPAAVPGASSFESLG